MVRNGRDPLAEREVMGRGPDPARLISAVVAEWLKHDQAGNRSLNEVERVVRRGAAGLGRRDRSRTSANGTSLR